MKELLYSEIAHRWEWVKDFKRGMGLAFNWQPGLATTTTPVDILTVSKTVAHPSYKEANEEETRLLLKVVFAAHIINIWEGVKW